MVADVVNGDTDEERETKPQPGGQRGIEVLIVPNTTLEPGRHLIEHPHRPGEHGTGVPTLGDHAGDDQGNHPGQEGVPVADVAVITVDGRDAELVHDVNAVEVPERASEGENPHAEGHHQRQSIAVEAVFVAEEGEPTGIASRVEHPTGHHASQNTGHGGGGPPRKEGVGCGLTLKVERRHLLPAGHEVRCGEGCKGIRCSGERHPKSNPGEDDHGLPFIPLVEVQQRAEQEHDGKEQGSHSIAKRQMNGLSTEEADQQHTEGNGRRCEVGLARSEHAGHIAQGPSDARDEQGRHVVHRQVVVQTRNLRSGNRQQHGKGGQQPPHGLPRGGCLRISMFVHGVSLIQGPASRLEHFGHL